MIAVPDFPAGAMENWGLIIYRESEMLYENGVNSARSLEDINIVIAHEVAHMVCNYLETSPNYIVYFKYQLKFIKAKSKKKPI